jgi:hypothetical protein
MIDLKINKNVKLADLVESSKPKTETGCKILGPRFGISMSE